MSNLASQAHPSTAALSAKCSYERSNVDVLGERMAYVSGGEGQTFLFLHGTPTSSYLWRNVMPFVETCGRVVAPDLIGFGHSAKPDLDYTLQTHARFLQGFIETLDLKDVIIIAHDWGSVLGLDYARNHAANVRGVVLMEAIVPPVFPMKDISELGEGAEFFQALRDPEQGKAMVMEGNVIVEEVLPAFVMRSLSEAEMAAYRAPFAEPASRFPTYAWPRELPIGGEPARNVAVIDAIGDWLRTSPVPKLIQYASPGGVINADIVDWMTQHYRHLEAQFIGYGTHFIQEDNPEAIGRGIAEWYRRELKRG